jgi:hypothetical protein
MHKTNTVDYAVVYPGPLAEARCEFLRCLREFCDRSNQAAQADNFRRHFPARRDQFIAQSLGFLGFFQFFSQVRPKNIYLPLSVTQRTLWAIDKVKPTLEKGIPLD